MADAIMDIQELPAVLTCKQLQVVLRLSRTKTYELVHRQDFPKLFVGRTIRIPKAAFSAWLERQVRGSEVV
jgi:excisionase family DNA binding protein